MGGGVYVVSSSPVMMISSCNSFAAAAAQLSLSLIIIMMCCSQQQQLVVVEAANYHRPSPSPSAASPAAPAELSSPRRPNTSVALILGLLTAIFSLTFILLILYVKHCTNTVITTRSTITRPPPYYSGGRNNSGIDRRLIESLPVFRFNNNNNKQLVVEGECAVCLTPFDAADVLRLLPKCKHAFHVECVDTWLDAHSTCPLCRVRVHADDLLLLIDTHQIPPPDVAVPSAGEINQHKRSIIKTTSVQEWATSFRRSLDDGAANFKKMKTTASVISYFDRSGGARKDGLLLLRTNGNDESETTAAAAEERRKRRLQIRWSDVQPSSHLLYLRSQMMLLHTHTSSLSEEEEEEFTGFTRFQFPTATS